MGLFQVNRHEIDGNPRTDSTKVGKASNPTRARARAQAARTTVKKGDSAWFTVDQATGKKK